MKNTILIDVNKRHVRVAMTQEGRLCEFYVEDSSHQKTVGNIYKGKVENVLAGMQAAFVRIGLERNAFLYVGETLYDKTVLEGTRFSEALNVACGDQIMVQVVKEESGTKGARISTDISLPGRLLIYIPNNDFVGISHKITEEKTREKLLDIIRKNKNAGEGFIVRTAAKYAGKKELLQEIALLQKKYQRVCLAYEQASVEEMVYSEGDLIVRTLRDIINDKTQKIYVNDRVAFEQIMDFFVQTMPTYGRLLEFYDANEPMFDHFGVSKEIDAILQKKVTLPNGAYLIFDKTEALHAIDVNTGKYTGGANLEQTVFETNMLAAKEIARQIRVRNLSGIIIVDFIDMEVLAHREEVVKTLREQMKDDRTKNNVVGMTGLGLVELTRKKIRKDISQVLLEECPYCNGVGMVDSARHTAVKIKSKLLEMFDRINPPSVIVTVSENIFGKIFLEGLFSEECETIWKSKRIYVVPDPLMKTSDFRLSAEGSTVLDLPHGARLLY